MSCPQSLQRDVISYRGGNRGRAQKLPKCVTVRKALTEMGHPQPPTPAEVDNQCDVGILAGTINKTGLDAWTCVSSGSKIIPIKPNSTFIGG